MRIKILLILSMVVLLFITSSQAELPTMSWINDCYEETYHTMTYPRYVNVHVEKTCYTNNFDYTTDPKYAWCYEEELNSSGEYSVVFEHSFDNGSIQDKLIRYNEDIHDGEYMYYYNNTICNRIGALVDDKIIDFRKCNIMCTKKDNIVQCDSCKDGNCNGLWQDGESGFKINLDNVKWWKPRIYSHSKLFQRLKQCVVK